MARTEEEVLQDLFDESINVGLLTGYFKESRIGLLFTTLSKEIAKMEAYEEGLEAQRNLVTATDEDVIENQASLFTDRYYASQSNVILRFYRNEVTGDIDIPINLVAETAAIKPIQYFVVEGKRLYDGEPFVDVQCLSVESGAATKVNEGELCILPIQIEDLIISNPEPSYGGRDDQTIEEMRSAALTSRYKLEHGTETAIKSAILEYGLESYEFALVDRAFGNGSFAVYLNIESDTVVEEVINIVHREKAEGVYAVIEKSEPLYCIFDFKIHLAQTQDMLQSEIDQLRLKIEDLFTDYIEKLPIGEDLIISKAVYFLFQGLYGFREDNVSDMHITTDSWLTKQDEHGNIILDDNEKISLESLKITIEVG